MEWKGLIYPLSLATAPALRGSSRDMSLAPILDFSSLVNLTTLTSLALSSLIWETRALEWIDGEGSDHSNDTWFLFHFFATDFSLPRICFPTFLPKCFTI